MTHPTPKYPTVIWDGLTENIDRVNEHSNVNPSAEDWERIAAEVISMQNSPGGVLLPLVTNSGLIIVTDDDGMQHPPTTSILILADATAGAITIDLPPAVSMVGKTIDVKKIDSSPNSITLDGNGVETIDDSLIQTLVTQYDAITILSDGTVWYII